MHVEPRYINSAIVDQVDYLIVIADPELFSQALTETNSKLFASDCDGGRAALKALTDCIVLVEAVFCDSGITVNSVASRTKNRH